MKPRDSASKGLLSVGGVIRLSIVFGVVMLAVRVTMPILPSPPGTVTPPTHPRSDPPTTSMPTAATLTTQRRELTKTPSSLATDTFVDRRLPQCTPQDRSSGVLLVGNRPVGTYLCEYFPKAKAVRGGCALTCEGLAVGSETDTRRVEPFTCTILAKGSVEQLKTADIVVNHHGPVPVQHRSEQITLFYSGESNASESKKALHDYQMKYTHVVSCHHHRRYYFTWTHRFAETFHNIAAGSHKFQPPKIDAMVIFVSRCGKGGRDAIIRRLMKAYDVHSFGKCARTHQIAETHPECVSPGKRYKEKACIFNKYRFALALDNTVEEDYVTEKVYHSLVHGPIPVYDGAPNANEFLPTRDSVIRLKDFAPNGSDFRSNPELIDVDALGRYLREVASQGQDSKHLAWRATPASWNPAFLENMAHPEPTCAVCAEALERRCAARK